MLLWDYEMGSERERLEGVPSDRRLSLALQVLDYTIEVMGQIAAASVAAAIAQGMGGIRDAVAEGQDQVVLPEGLLDGYMEILEVIDEPGAPHILSAIMACSEAPEGLTAEVLYGIFSFCYEGTVDREMIPVVNLDSERNNVRCVEAISFQKRLISAYASGSTL